MTKLSLVWAVLGLSACGASGTARFTAWGEEYIEDGLPASDFEDGWRVKYEKFLVVIGEITLAHRGGKPVATQPVPKVFDLVKKGPVEVETFGELPPARYEKVGYAIAPSSQAVAGNADAADATALVAAGRSLYLEGTATKGPVTKRFKWGFSTNTRLEDCQAEGFGAGLTVPSGGVETVELTVHGDHFFYDHLQSNDSKLRFDAIANADGLSGDGEVTLEELQKVDLSSLPQGQYGGASAEKSLKDFVTTLSRTVGHFRGEGECVGRSR